MRRAPPAKGWASIFAVYAGTGDVPRCSGTYAVEGGSLVFHPTFSDRARRALPRGFSSAGRRRSDRENFRRTAARDHSFGARRARLSIGGCSAEQSAPAVHLFLRAHEPGRGRQRIHVLDENGKVLPGVFLPGEELWDPNFRRLTMTFDPGRIKRGLTSNEAMGPPIAEGKRYTLVIDRDWPDARGVPMAEGFRKIFSRRAGRAQSARSQAMASDRAQGGHVRRSGGELPHADELSAAAEDASGFRRARQRGRNGEHRQAMKPNGALRRSEPWKPGDYQLVVDTALEDLAGNHIGQPFDIDVFEHVTEHIATNTISLPFAVR